MVQLKSLSVDDNIYAPLPEIVHSAEGINSCQSCMQSSTNEPSTPVSGSVKRKQTNSKLT